MENYSYTVQRCGVESCEVQFSIVPLNIQKITNYTNQVASSAVQWRFVWFGGAKYCSVMQSFLSFLLCQANPSSAMCSEAQHSFDKHGIVKQSIVQEV